MTDIQPKMDLYEEFAILTSLSKVIKQRTDEVRSLIEQDFLSDPSNDRKALLVGGKKVGTISRRQSKGDYYIIDQEAFDDFALTYGFARYNREIPPASMQEALDYLEENRPDLVTNAVVVDSDWKDYMFAVDDAVTYMGSSEIVPGVDYDAPRDIGVMVRDCAWKKVAPAINGSIDALLLGDGND